MHTQKQNNHQTGFTLLELMVVNAIAGVLAAVALPLPGYPVKSAVMGGKRPLVGNSPPLVVFGNDSG